jgi:hypothetical protein
MQLTPPTVRTEPVEVPSFFPNKKAEGFDKLSPNGNWGWESR